MLSRPLVIPLVAALTFVAARGAGAQIESTLRAERTVAKPISTVTFTPYSLSGTLDGVNVLANMWAVTVATMSRVLLQSYHQSQIRLYTNPAQPLPGGAYDVVFSIPWVGGGGAAATITRAGTVLGQCQLAQQTSYAAGAPIQTCVARIFDVTDGKLDVEIKIDAGQFDVSNITVNRYR